MQSSEPIEAPRPYRSRIRPRPCDRCRRLKHGCQVVESPPCQRCVKDDRECTFQSRPTNRRSGAHRRDNFAGTTQHLADDEHANIAGEPLSNNSADVGDTDGLDETLAESGAEAWIASLPSASIETTSSLGNPATQIAQSLDQLDDHTIQMVGPSADLDPWLLRHCRFDQFGFCSLQNMAFRNAGGVPLQGKIPIQFMAISDNVMCGGTNGRTDQALESHRPTLDSLIPISHGEKLIHLFLKHVFHWLPVVSRSQLGFGTESAVTLGDALSKTPVHLLAALYATALPYSAEDAELAMLYSDYRSTLVALWELVSSLIMGQSHRPKLSTVQAGILYLHKDTHVANALGSTEDPSTWSFLGMITGLATGLGLHIECCMWAVPAWEKRLRRRLWWALFSEDKWRSLLMGRPPYIQQGEWDVAELTSEDFFGLFDTTFSHAGCSLEYPKFIQLTMIAETIQRDFYSLKASQAISGSLSRTLQAAKPLLDRLHQWRASTHTTHPAPETGSNTLPPSLHLAYLSLLIYIYRALLRPTVKNKQPREIIHLESFDLNALMTFDFPHWTSTTGSLPTESVPDPSGSDDLTANSLGTLYQAAQGCARGLLEFTKGLSCIDLASFWFSWAQSAFSVGSSFIVLLTIQTPDYAYMTEAQEILRAWRFTLQYQSRVNCLLHLAFSRANAFSISTQNIFFLPAHVSQALAETGVNYQQSI